MRSSLLPEVKAVVDGVEGWLSDREASFLFDTAARCRNRGAIVEIGSYKGKSTVCMGLGAGSHVMIYAIDPHMSDLEHRGQGSSLEVFQRNVARAGLADSVIPIVAKSQDVAWSGPIEFLWIDGDHTYQGAWADFVKYSPYVIEGGIIAFHDATQDEVPKVVVRAFRQQGYVDIRVVDSIAYAQKVTRGRKSWRDSLSLLLIGHYADFRRLRVFRPFKEPIKRALARI